MEGVYYDIITYNTDFGGRDTAAQVFASSRMRRGAPEELG